MRKFKNHDDYLAQRNEALATAEGHLEAGNMEEYQAAVDEVNAIDADYAEFAEQQANIQAMRDAVHIPNVLADNGSTAMMGGMLQDNSNKEYRMAFMNYVMNGTKIPASLMNVDATTTTSDVGPVIPNTILDRIIEKIEATGNILAKVTRTYYKGGVTVPTSSAKPTATWTTERGTTDKQKKSVGSVTFNYYKLKVQVAVSLMVSNITLEVFERTIANNIAEAIVKALETAIIAGTGSGQPKGILKETAPEGQKIEIKKGASVTYADLCSVEGALPSGYDDAEWLMNKKTFMSQVVGMVDSNKQPIARMNAGIDGKPAYTILGRPVNFSEDMPNWSATVDADTTIGAIVRLEDYMLNTNMDVTVSKYTDQETDDEVTKAIMLADGKMIDTNSLVFLNIKATS